MTTKEQERKALEQIREIVNGLGEDSYIGAAFEGCFEIAEENIENDFACSMKQRAESAEAEAHHQMELAKAYKSERDAAERKLANLQAETVDPLTRQRIISVLQKQIIISKANVDTAAEQIIVLADNADQPEFRRAVAEHRQTKSEVEMLSNLIAKLSD